MEPLVLWQHKWSHGPYVPAYLFFGGLTAGIFIVAVIADLIGIWSRRAATVSRLAAYLAVPVLGLAGFFLTVHLGKPERGLGFMVFFTNYNSWMTRGGWIVAIGSIFVIAYAALWWFRLAPARRIVGVIGIPALAGLAVYTGLLLSGAWYVPLWSQDYLPLLFLNSGLTTGVAAAGLIFILAWPFLGERGLDPRPAVRWLGLALVLLIAVELYELNGFMNYLSEKASPKATAPELAQPTGEFRSAMGGQLAWQYVTGGAGYPWRLFQAEPAEAAIAGAHVGTLAPWFWFGIIGLGLTIPLLLTIIEFGTEFASRRLADGIAAVKFACVLVGGLLLRFVIVWGGDLKAPLPFPPSKWPVPGMGGPPLPGLGG